MEIWQIIVLIAGIIVGLFIIGFIVCGSIFYHFVFDRRKGDKDFAKNEDPKAKNAPDRLWYFSQKIEELEIKSFDRLSLKGYLISNNSNKLAIILHGYRGRYYSNVTQARIFYEAGYDVLLPNNRAHDTSSGGQFSMGPKETKDLLRWIDLMIKRNPNYQIALMGISMGGHIVMMTVGENLPNNVKCFVEDCGYVNTKEELATEMARSMHFKRTGFIMALNNAYIKIFHNFSMKNSTLKSLPNCKIPGLFMHGDRDDFVPYKDMERNYNALPNSVDKEKVTFFDAGHNQAHLQVDKYRESIINFVNKYIK